MTTFVFRLQAPRATFAQDMTDEERKIMGGHAAHWQRFIDAGQMVPADRPAAPGWATCSENRYSGWEPIW